MKSNFRAEGKGNDQKHGGAEIARVSPVSVDARSEVRIGISDEIDSFPLGYDKLENIVTLVGKNVPAQVFFPKMRIAKMNRHPNEILDLCLADTTGAVTPEFGVNAPNNTAAAFYSMPDAHTEDEGGACRFFASGRGRLLNYAFAIAIRDQVEQARVDKHQPRTIRIKELCAGGDPRRWTAMGDALRGWHAEVVLTDFPGAKDPDGASIESDYHEYPLRIQHEDYSLFDPMSRLSESQKFDAMFVTYGFDSVWLPEDARYAKRGDKWYKFTYRVKVSQSAPPRTREELVRSMQEMRAPDPAVVTPASFLHYVNLEEAVEEINIDEVPFADEIKRRSVGLSQFEVDFPGGMIRVIVDAMKNQVNEDGIFVMSDAGIFEQSQEKFHPNSHHTPRRTGGAFFRSGMDIILAKEILEKKYNLKVEVRPLHDFAMDRLEEFPHIKSKIGTREFREMVEGGNLFVMVVSRQSSISMQGGFKLPLQFSDQ